MNISAFAIICAFGRAGRAIAFSIKFIDFYAPYVHFEREQPGSCAGWAFELHPFVRSDPGVNGRLSIDRVGCSRTVLDRPARRCGACKMMFYHDFNFMETN